MPIDELPNNRSRKPYSYKCYIKVNGILTQVCRSFFTVFGISVIRIKRINQCTSLHKSPVIMTWRICWHTEKFEVHENALWEQNKNLDARLDVAKMHNMFVSDNPDLKDKVKYSFYYKYFKENLSFCFGRPYGWRLFNLWEIFLI